MSTVSQVRTPTVATNVRLTAWEGKLVVFLALINASTMLIGRHTRTTGFVSKFYNITHLIIVAEIAKFGMAAVLESREQESLVASLRKHVWNNPRDALKMAFPSVLYFVQNLLLYDALGRVSVPIFQLLYQSKLIFNALVSVLLLGRTYRPIQWLCIVVVALGIGIVYVEQTQEPFFGYELRGVAAAIGAAVINAVNCVYFEKVIKSKTPTTSLLQELVPIWSSNNDESEQLIPSPTNKASSAIDNTNETEEGSAVTTETSLIPPPTNEASSAIENTNETEEGSAVTAETSLIPPPTNEASSAIENTNETEEGSAVTAETSLIPPPTNEASSAINIANEIEEGSAVTAENSAASLWMRSMQYSFFAVLVGIGKDIYNDFFGLSYEDWGVDWRTTFGVDPDDWGFFHGFTVWVWLLVFTQALGGLVAVSVIMYTDTVIKGFALALSVVLSTAASGLLFGTPLTLGVFVGAGLILASVILFGMHVSVATDGRSFYGCLLLRSSPSPTRDTAELSNARESLVTPLLVV